MWFLNSQNRDVVLDRVPPEKIHFAFTSGSVPYSRKEPIAILSEDLEFPNQGFVR